MNDSRPIRFAIIGLDHQHVYGQTAGLIEAGAELVGAATRDEAAGVPIAFRQMYPDVPTLTEAEILADPTIDLIVTAAIPVDRAGIAVSAMRAGKDVMADKPGCTTFEQLEEIRAAVAETGRIWSVTFSERFEVPAVARAGEIARSGAIGRVVQTLGLGPHREGDRLHLGAAGGRPAWFYDEANFGGILVDIASHQIDQFLWFTGSERGEITASTVANYTHPDDPGMQDFGEMLLRSDHAHGYIRVDWYNTQGLPTWGDGRLFILGTEGYMELRKYIDLDGKPGTNHLFWVNDDGVHYESLDGVATTYHADVLHDVRHRTETACPQEHTFEVSRLALVAQAEAIRRGNLR